MTPWARLRKHGPTAIFDWHETEEAARVAIELSAEKYGEQVRKFQTVAYFPDEENRPTSENRQQRPVSSANYAGGETKKGSD